MVWAIRFEAPRRAPLPDNASLNRYPQPRQVQLRCGILPKANAASKRKLAEFIALSPHGFHTISTVPGIGNFRGETVRKLNETRINVQILGENARPLFHRLRFNRPFQNLYVNACRL